MIKKSIYFSVLLIVLLGAYYAIISLSERRDFAKSSLDYYLLAPNLFKNLSPSDSIEERYIYSSSDGNKPMVISFIFHSIKDSAQIKSDLKEYLNSNGYKLVGSSFSDGENREITIETTDNNANVIVKLTMLEYIK
ncbi:hypothetical protein V6237_14125 [Pseudoalteromonas carrageenovora]|uniref:hypothetical protein n=1 Tax=Pseudoalteromonas carrageenovora TaxID=227 RepID=UPI00311D41C4